MREINFPRIKRLNINMAKKKKKEEDDDFKDFMNFLRSRDLNGMDIEEGEEVDEECFDEACPCFGGASVPFSALLALESISKPFGMTWIDENIERFLDNRGYVILHLTNSKGILYHTALKKSEGMPIPATDEELANCYSVHQVFEKEVQSILIDWLLKIGNNNNKNNGK